MCALNRCDAKRSAFRVIPVAFAPAPIPISIGRLPDRTCTGCDKCTVFRLLDDDVVVVVVGTLVVIVVAIPAAAATTVVVVVDVVVVGCGGGGGGVSFNVTVLSSNTGLSIEYEGLLPGDFDRFIFVIRLIRLTVVDDCVPKATKYKQNKNISQSK